MARAGRMAIGVLASLCLVAPSTASAVGEVRESGSATAETSPAAASSDVRLRVPSGLAAGAPLTTMAQIGSTPVTVGVARLANGQATVAANLWDGRGVRLPAYSSSNNPPRAVVRITPVAGSGDPLAPGTSDFTFGIYFKKDAKSSGTEVDNGDNLLQRGVWTDTAQYKLQVDGDRPSCVIKGDRGRVIVNSSVLVSSSLWYQARCTRTGNTVRLTVKEYQADGSSHTVVSTGSGTIGSLRWANRQTPVAVGGALDAQGSILPHSSDQFNGWVTHPSLDIHD